MLPPAKPYLNLVEIKHRKETKGTSFENNEEKKMQPSQLARLFCCSFDICAPTILKVTLKPLLADGGWRGGSGRPSASAQSIRFVQDALHVFNDREFQAPLQPGFHSTAWTQRRGHICARVKTRPSHLSWGILTMGTAYKPLL